uniref:Uncharacterized protein n=1 Tax=Anguilla anguilla TaxID=7936 RepID=A0A0E9R074_ANGAN
MFMFLLFLSTKLTLAQLNSLCCKSMYWGRGVPDGYCSTKPTCRQVPQSV